MSLIAKPTSVRTNTTKTTAHGYPKCKKESETTAKDKHISESEEIFYLRVE